MKNGTVHTNVVLAVFFLLLFLSFFSGCMDSAEETKPEMDFVFTTIDGRERSLSDYFGTVLVVDLMGVNCPPCLYQMFELVKISENYSRQDVTIISINVWISRGETRELLLEYIDAFKQELNISLDWVFGVDDALGTIERTYAKEGVPTLYILDKKGNIYYTQVGYESYSTLKIKLDELLNT